MIATESQFPASHRPLVSFLICGTQKGGTTALDGLLRQHPRVVMFERPGSASIGGRKEAHFFDDDAHFDGAPDYGLYHAMFGNLSPGQIAGESTPIYMYWQDAPRRIWQYNPNLKIILLLRNPVNRAFSHWNMERLRGNENLPFLEAVQNETERCRVALPKQHRIRSYVDRGFYAEQIRRMLRLFPRDRILILKSEDFFEEPVRTASEVFKFLEVEKFTLHGAFPMHQGSYDAPLPESASDFLHKTYYHSIKDLEGLIGWELNDWLERN